MAHTPGPRTGRIPSDIPVYRLCNICNQPEESDRMMDGMCRECVECLRRGLWQVRKNRESDRPGGFYWPVAATMAGVAVWIMWRWIR